MHVLRTLIYGARMMVNSTYRQPLSAVGFGAQLLPKQHEPLPHVSESVQTGCLGVTVGASLLVLGAGRQALGVMMPPQPRAPDEGMPHLYLVLPPAPCDNPPPDDPQPPGLLADCFFPLKYSHAHAATSTTSMPFSSTTVRKIDATSAESYLCSC